MAPPDIQYCLDSMVDLHMLTGDVYTYLMEFKNDLTHWFDNLDEIYPSGPDNVDKHEYYAFKEYNKWRGETSHINRAYATYMGVKQLQYSIKDNCLAIANDAIDKFNTPNPTPNQINKVLFTGKTQEKFLRNFNFIFENAQVDFTGLTLNSLSNIANQIKKKQRKRYLLEFGMWDQPRKYKNINHHQKRERSIMKKSVNTLQNFLGPNDTQIFLGNDYVDITGKHFTFKVKKNRTLIHTGWNALDINVHDRETREYLCKLCFYYDNMPTADQLTALILDINAGNEKQVIRTGNIYQITDDAQSHPILLEYNDNNAKLLSNKDKFPLMESSLLREYEPSENIEIADFNSIFQQKNRENFDQVLEMSKDLLYNKLRKKFALFQGFDNTLALI